MTRVSNYKFTVQMQDGKPVADDQVKLDELRAFIKNENAVNGTKKYVKLQGRGPRRDNWKFRMGLPLKYATSADVYIYERGVLNSWVESQ